VASVLDQNPLLQPSLLPVFSKILPAHVEPALDALLAKSRQTIARVLQQPVTDQRAFLALMEQCDDELSQMWSPVSHLNGVKNSEALREAYEACLPKLTEYSTEMGQNKALFQAYQSVADSAEFEQLPVAQQKAVNNALRDFRLSGVALDDEKQQRYGEIQKRLAQLTTSFSNNVLDATHGWSKHVIDADQLQGVPATAMAYYQQAAEAKDLSGYLITLDIPAYLPLMQYCDNRELREEMYQAYTTRASDHGPNAGQWDNSELMKEILALRHELSLLLGFNNYAERSLATKMAESPSQVEKFLLDLAEKSLPVAKKDFSELQHYAEKQGVDRLNAWDVPYFSEKLRVEKYALSQEQVREYFPADNVINGMFEIVSKLFAITFSEQDVDSWHPDVRFFTC
jgi:oligopeptidase A